MNNKYGEINVNLSLIIEVAPVIRDRPIVKKVEKKKSAVLQCAVQGTQNIDVQWFKEGQGISATKGARFSVEKKKSDVREGETSKAWIVILSKEFCKFCYNHNTLSKQTFFID